MDNQIKNSFDAVTLQKIARGALIAGTGTAGLYLLGWLSTLNYGTVWAPVIAGIIPFLINAIREYMKGETPKLGHLMSRTIRKNKPVKYRTAVSKQVKRALKSKRRDIDDIPDGSFYKREVDRRNFD